MKKGAKKLKIIHIIIQFIYSRFGGFFKFCGRFSIFTVFQPYGTSTF